MKKELTKILRITGFESDSRGIINRFINVDGAWDEHLKNSRNFIIQCLQKKKIQNLAVYGSGWLLDFPLEEASELAVNIRLYDLVHPRQVLHKLKKFRNITAVQSDVTGGVLPDVFSAMHMYRKTGEKPDIPGLCNRMFVPDIIPDYAVSLNILSQLGDLILNYISGITELSVNEKNSIIKILQEQHLKLLYRQPSCLITDTEEFSIDKASTIAATKSLIRCSLPEGYNNQSWEWHFDPLGEYNPGFTTKSKVIAMELIQSKE